MFSLRRNQKSINSFQLNVRCFSKLAWESLIVQNECSRTCSHNLYVSLSLSTLQLHLCFTASLDRYSTFFFACSWNNLRIFNECRNKMPLTTKLNMKYFVNFIKFWNYWRSTWQKVATLRVLRACFRSLGKLLKSFSNHLRMSMLLRLWSLLAKTKNWARFVHHSDLRRRTF